MNVSDSWLDWLHKHGYRPHVRVIDTRTLPADLRRLAQAQVSTYTLWQRDSQAATDAATDATQEGAGEE